MESLICVLNEIFLKNERASVVLSSEAWYENYFEKTWFCYIQTKKCADEPWKTFFLDTIFALRKLAHAINREFSSFKN